jgi:hypothetical protein
VDGFLLLKSADGKIIAVGDLINIAHGDLVHSRLVFRFHDGSIDDEVTVFRQRSTLQLISDHHIQKGPSFPQPLDVLLNARTGKVTSRTWKDGKEDVQTEHIDMPPDLANGMLPAILENLPPHANEAKVGYIAGDPKPRLVALSIKPVGGDHFNIDGRRRDALVYNIHVDLSGVAAVVAPLIGKDPADTQIWVSAGEVHAFVKLQGALYLKGPIWTMELTSPRWP